MPMVGGCLTMKNQCDARLFSHDALRYDPGIPSVMPVAGGYLTMKNPVRCPAI
jgi:hypothetical protein